MAIAKHVIRTFVRVVLEGNVANLNERITEIGETVLADLEGVNAARERALAESRQIVRLSANTIRAVHRHDFDEADGLLSEARRMNDGLAELLADYPQIYWAGYMRDAQKEFAEATITLSIIAGRDLPSPATIGVENSVYLNGLGEAAGEMRRYALDAMRRWDLDRAEQILGVMDEIYGLLVTVDYPDAVTGGLRRTTDMVRGVLERTRGDLTVVLQQRTLTEALGRVEAKLDAANG
jgi:translin